MIHERIIPSPKPHKFSIMCGNAAVGKLIREGLEAAGYQHDLTASIVIIIDANQGFAVRQLEMLDRGSQQVIVTTYNDCPEYWLDLADFQPTALIVSDNLRQELNTAIQEVANGKQYRLIPHTQSKLTSAQRFVLRYVARGWTNEEIGRLRQVSSKTIANTIADICERLQVRDRYAAGLYYWGRTDLLY